MGVCAKTVEQRAGAKPHAVGFVGSTKISSRIVFSNNTKHPFAKDWTDSLHVPRGLQDYTGIHAITELTRAVYVAGDHNGNQAAPSILCVF